MGRFCAWAARVLPDCGWMDGKSSFVPGRQGATRATALTLRASIKMSRVLLRE